MDSPTSYNAVAKPYKVLLAASNVAVVKTLPSLKTKINTYKKTIYITCAIRLINLLTNTISCLFCFLSKRIKDDFHKTYC